MAMAKFLLRPDNEDLNIAQVVQNDPNEDNFEAQLKRARLAIPVVADSKYVNLSFIKPDTCVVERLFSMTNKVWVEGRKSMTPAHTELLLMLKCNRSLWDSHLVYKCRSNPRIRPNVAGAADEMNEEAADAAPDQLVELLDGDEEQQYVFMEGGEDADFWDDDNIAEMLGDIDI